MSFNSNCINWEICNLQFKIDSLDSIYTSILKPNYDEYKIESEQKLMGLLKSSDDIYPESLECFSFFPPLIAPLHF